MKSLPASRRGLFRAAAGLALAGSARPAAPTLPTVRLGKYEITRLILGSNPFNGYCYALPSLSEHMKEWSTPERITGVLRQALDNGINTWQFGYSERCMDALKLHQSQGGRLQWILLSSGPAGDNPAMVAELAKLKPIGIAHHGGVTDRRFRAGQMDKVRDFLKVVRDSGVMVGLSTHLPAVIEHVEQQNWDVDFYMTCFYQFGRTSEDLRRLVGELPVGTTFLEGDPARMCRVIRQTRRPCLAFKILAAGRAAESAKGLEQAFRFAFENIKPQDAVIVGMYPRFKDEVRENAELARRICS